MIITSIVYIYFTLNTIHINNIYYITYFYFSVVLYCKIHEYNIFRWLHFLINIFYRFFLTDQINIKFVC